MKSLGLTKEQLTDLYVTQKMTTREIGKELNASQCCVCRYMKKFGIQVRKRKLFTKKELEKLYYDDFLSATKIGKMFGISKVAIRYHLKKHNIKTRRTTDYAGRLPSGKDSHNWKGGKFQCSKTGYVIHIKNGKHFPEHRLIMEKHLKRPLKKDEVVHHINGVTDDNRIENLMIMDSSNHSQLHWKYVKELKKRIRFLEKEVKRLSPS